MQDEAHRGAVANDGALFHVTVHAKLLTLGLIAHLLHFLDFLVVRLAFGDSAHREPCQHANDDSHDGAELPVRIHDPLLKLLV